MKVRRSDKPVQGFRLDWKKNRIGQVYVHIRLKECRKTMLYYNGYGVHCTEYKLVKSPTSQYVVPVIPP